MMKSYEKSSAFITNEYLNRRSKGDTKEENNKNCNVCFKEKVQQKGVLEAKHNDGLYIVQQDARNLNSVRQEPNTRLANWKHLMEMNFGIRLGTHGPSRFIV